MERSRKAIVARAGFAWDDLGSWAALQTGEAPGRERDARRSLLVDSTGTIAFAERG